MSISSSSSLREVVISDGLRRIENSAFYECSSLLSITIPSTVDDIDMGTFSYCNSLREVVLRDGLKKIKAIAIRGCTSSVYPTR